MRETSAAEATIAGAAATLSSAMHPVSARGRLDDENRIKHHLQRAIRALEEALAVLHDDPEKSPAQGPPGDVRSARDTGVFRREGEYWTIAYGAAPCRLRDTIGLTYISLLLAQPGREVHALDLVAMAGRDRGGHGGPGLAYAGDAGEVLDPQAKAAYRRRLTELAEDLDEANAWHDAERASRARQEIDAITEQLAAAVGLGGRDRRMASPAERARVSTTKAIRQAIARIGRHDQALEQHLRVSVRTGLFHSYTPDPGVTVRWHL